MKLNELCKRAELAIRLGANEYSVAVCQHIISYCPKHIQARSLLGQAYLEQGSHARAVDQFKAVLEVDPENVVARTALGVVYDKMGELSAAIEQLERAFQLSPTSSDVADGLRQLYEQRDGSPPEELQPPPGAIARLRAKRKQYSLAIKEFDDVLAGQPGNIEILTARAEALWRGGQVREAERACMTVLQKAPNTLKAKLILAEIMTRDRSREKQGLALLHEAQGMDPGGRLAKDLFKETSFTVPDLGEELEFPAPSNGGGSAPPEVEAALAMLPKAATVDVDLEPDPLYDFDLDDESDRAQAKALVTPDILRIQTDLERIANALNSAVDGERRSLAVPQAPSVQTTTTAAEIIITSKKRLIAKYGSDAFTRLERKLQDLIKLLGDANIDGRLAYVDDEDSLQPFGLHSVDAADADKVKSVVDGIGKSLSQTGRSLEYVLIVGGDSIVPFFRAHNPTEDDDEYVLTDNPYASQAADILVPERAVGRMPDSENGGISLIMAQVETALAHRHQRSPLTQPLGCLALLLTLGISVKLPKPPPNNSLGYAALVWKDSAASVFEAIGSGQALVTVPPITEESFDPNWLLGSSLNYFNLHGSKDSEHWYGQKDLSYPEDYPMLPIALSPATIAKSSVSSSLIFSEACYGANIIGKSQDSSIALRFLADGALGFVGSTVTAYGVAAPPLSGADVLAIHFWHHLTSGLSIGQALMKAKVTFADDINQKQGWLDGDDQKTLLEFVLYGDPSSHLDKVPDSRPKAGYQPDSTLTKQTMRQQPHLVCKHRSPLMADADLPAEFIRHAVSHLHSCCPEMYGAGVRVHRSISCNGECDVDYHPGVKGPSPHGPEDIWHQLMHFTSRKSFKTADGKETWRFARATMDKHGNIVKTTISR